jgi:hypothetical protein
MAGTAHRQGARGENDDIPRRLAMRRNPGALRARRADQRKLLPKFRLRFSLKRKDSSLFIRDQDLGPSRLRVPVLAIVNTADAVVPPGSVKTFLDKVRGQKPRIREYPREAGVGLQHLAALVGRHARTDSLAQNFHLASRAMLNALGSMHPRGDQARYRWPISKSSQDWPNCERASSR